MLVLTELYIIKMISGGKSGGKRGTSDPAIGLNHGALEQKLGYFF